MTNANGRVKTITQLMGKHKARGDSADKRLSEAWLAIREGRCSREDADIALVDLAWYTGYYAVSPRGTTNDELQFDNGMRAAFGRIAYLLDLTMSDTEAFRGAVLDEMETDREEL